MTTAHARAVAFALGTTLRVALVTASVALVAQPALAAPDCAAGTAGDDVCIITLNNTNTEAVDAGGNTPAGDKLQFGGAANFSFDVGRIGGATGDPLKNFEVFEKIGGNVVTLTGTAKVQTNWTVSGGTLLATGSTSGAGNILDSSAVTVAAGATFGLIGAGGASETIAELNAAAGSFITLGGTGTLTTQNTIDTTIAGIISGTGNFAKNGPGVLHLNADNTYTGTTTVSGGVLDIGNAGAIDNSSSVTINAGAIVRSGTTAYTVSSVTINSNGLGLGQLEGNVTVTGNVSSNGVLKPGLYVAPPSGSAISPPSFGTINIGGNYASTGTTAFLDMDVNLDAALPGPAVNGTTHDFLNIQGNVSGTSYVFLTEFDAAADAGLATTGNGIQLIRIGGTNTAGAFLQGNALNAGVYQYLLRYVANYNVAGDDGYFLQSAVRDEMFAHPALLSASQQLVRNCHRNDQRVPDSPKNATYGRAWVDYHQGATSYGPDTGVEMDLDFSCTTGGMDWRMGNGWFGGVVGGFGDANADVAAPAGVGSLDGRSRTIEVYAAFTSSSFFLNLSAGYTDIDWAFSGALLPTTNTSVSGFIAGAQAGAALDLDFIAVKLIGALNYDDQNCGETCFGFAVTEDTGLLEAKGTVRFDGVSSSGSYRPWVAVSFSDVLSDGINSVSLNGITVGSDANSQLLSIDAGLQAYLDENFALFADGGYHESLAKDINGYKAGVGLKLYW